ncbi:MAG: secretin and TonB N-terminal domain-containing protein, partial [Nitrososphaera sp.]|nr:secretin and TonB N-terminal domain-containing protein [Nitrososphaera sp.]
MKKHTLVLMWSGVFLACLSGERILWAQQENQKDPSLNVSEGEVLQDEQGDAEGLALSTATSASAGTISIDFKDADIRQVLRVISMKSGVDIVAGNDVEGLVTIKLTEVPWEQALDIILRTYGFTYEKKGNIVRVTTIEALEQEALATQVFPLDYAKAKEVPDVIKEMLSDRGRVKFDERTNTVIVTDIPTTLFQIATVIKRLDQRTPQVLIESRIVETKLEEDENLGIDWTDLYSLTQSQNAYP